MELTTLLYITFIIYMIVMTFGFVFKIKWLFMIGGVLWLVPITQLDNMFLIVVCSVMVVAHGILGFYEKDESEF